MRSTTRMLLAVLVTASLPPAALAGGMQLPLRGVRATARGGAMTAGADGLAALGMNPAGLARIAAEAPSRQILVDVAYVDQSGQYRRIDSGMNPQDAVTSSAPGLPIPTIGVTWALSDRMVLGVGVYAPYAALGSYPDAGPQRYSLVDMSESLLAITEIALGYRVSDRLRVGAALQNMGMFLAASMVFSGCPAQIVCAPEDPEFDAMGKVTQLSVFTPSAAFGVQYDLSSRVRVGAALQLPFFINGSGTFQTRLPPSGFFDGAHVEGDRADVSFTWPAVIRAGVELEPARRVRLELAASVELWSLHEDFLIEPRGVTIQNAPGVGAYEVGEIRVPRNFHTTYAAHIGVEAQPVASLPLSLLAGYTYETAAAPDEYLSVMTIDGSKHVVAGGLGYVLGPWHVHATVGFAAVADRSVAPDVGKAPQINPIRAETDDVFVNWGDYSSSWLVAGAGVSRGF